MQFNKLDDDEQGDGKKKTKIISPKFTNIKNMD